MRLVFDVILVDFGRGNGAHLARKPINKSVKCEKYLKKGDKVYIEGRIKTRKWTDDTGNDRYSTEIHCVDFTFLTPKDKSASQADHNSSQEVQNMHKTATTNIEHAEDDLPF